METKLILCSAPQDRQFSTGLDSLVLKCRSEIGLRRCVNIINVWNQFISIWIHTKCHILMNISPLNMDNCFHQDPWIILWELNQNVETPHIYENKLLNLFPNPDPRQNICWVICWVMPYPSTKFHGNACGLMGEGGMYRYHFLCSLDFSRITIPSSNTN